MACDPDSCKPGYIYDFRYTARDTAACWPVCSSPCPSGQSCIAPNVCAACDVGKCTDCMSNATRCWGKCEAGFTQNGDATKCVPCAGGCLTCHIRAPSSCDSCQSGYLNTNGGCQKCSSGRVFHVTSGYDNEGGICDQSAGPAVGCPAGMHMPSGGIPGDTGCSGCCEIDTVHV
jgi:hypothetical protein